MIRRPPRSTRTDTLFPYTTLFRSSELGIPGKEYRPSLRRYYPDQVRRVAGCSALNLFLHTGSPGMAGTIEGLGPKGKGAQPVRRASQTPAIISAMPAVRRRSEERRVGKECVRTCRSRGAPYH